MTTNHLLRELAPLSDAAWSQVDTEARTRLTTQLAARKLVDFDGPHGWMHSAVSLGHVTSIAAPAAGPAQVRQRQVLAIVEVRVPFSVGRDAIEDAGRGADDIDLSELDDASRKFGVIENTTVFHGYEAAGITGITRASSHDSMALGEDFDAYPTTVARAVSTLRSAGIDGPYGLAIGPTGYTGIIETTEHGGLLLLDHLHQILGGPVVWAPGVDGAVVLSLRGGDFQFVSGQDLSIGYLAHDAEIVRLYLEESFAFRVIEPDAAVALSQ
ncbi:MAG TPA: family 1 encapsulin nanocompartment shell protein [Acidimicrobiales bacterium]|nr:family 1 encapsulin nanocompartment shell protein [Acidimicrobiales bacterium]